MRVYPRLIYLITVVMLFAVPALAQDGGTVTDDDVNRVARQLYCPQCENVTLDVCGTTACIAWRKEIRERLAEGWSDEAIIDYFKTQYGQRVLSSPDDPVIKLLLVAIPVVAVLLGVVVIIAQQRRSRAIAENGAPDTGEPDIEAYRARLERELDEEGS